jgi:hypothetical protein
LEQLPLSGFVRALFDGYKEGREERYYPRKFEELEHTNLLFEVDELNDLYGHSKSKYQHELILDHMYRFDATRVKYYKQIEKKIINHYWEG